MRKNTNFREFIPTANQKKLTSCFEISTEEDYAISKALVAYWQERIYAIFCSFEETDKPWIFIVVMVGNKNRNEMGPTADVPAWGSLNSIGELQALAGLLHSLL